jgi:hypothetical protein
LARGPPESNCRREYFASFTQRAAPESLIESTEVFINDTWRFANYTRRSRLHCRLADDPYQRLSKHKSPVPMPTFLLIFSFWSRLFSLLAEDLLNNRAVLSHVHKSKNKDRVFR